MNAAQVVMLTGVVGVAAGVGYAIRQRRNGGSDAEQCARCGTPAGEPSAPLAEPEHARLDQRINRSRNQAGTVLQSPEALLEQARAFDPVVTLDELTGARLAASEHGSGSSTELACIVDSELNRAEKSDKTLFASATRGHGFGKQGRERPASTRRDPTMRHLLASRSVLSGEARGVARGAVRFFDPVAMERLHAKYRRWVEGGRKGDKPAIVSCDALTLLEAWSFDYRKKSGNRCPPDRSKSGRHTLAWVADIPGVDPLRLFLMAPVAVGSFHQSRYEQARKVLLHGLGKE